MSEEGGWDRMKRRDDLLRRLLSAAPSPAPRPKPAGAVEPPPKAPSEPTPGDRPGRERR